MEGTKHEKAVIVLLAYIVGFTAGFIAFGVSKTNVPEEVIEVVANDTETLTQIAPTKPVEQTELPISDSEKIEGELTDDYSNPTGSGKGTQAYYKNNRLFVSVEGKVNLLSVAKSKLTADVSSIFSNQGSHVAIPKYEVSPNGKYVYFCEQQTDVTECLSFVYDVANQIIQYVVADGKKVLISTEEAKKVTWKGNTLAIGVRSSEAAELPWKLAN